MRVEEDERCTENTNEKLRGTPEPLESTEPIAFSFDPQKRESNRRIEIRLSVTRSPGLSLLQLRTAERMNAATVRSGCLADIFVLAKLAGPERRRRYRGAATSLQSLK